MKIRGRVIRVDHVSRYRRPGVKDGNVPAWADMDEESAAMNVAPQMIYHCNYLCTLRLVAASDSEKDKPSQGKGEKSDEDLDLLFDEEDPMKEYMKKKLKKQRKKEEKKKRKESEKTQKQ